MDWIERLEKLVRPALAIAFGAAFIIGFLALRLINSDVFTGTAGFVLGYYFRSRDADKAQQATQQAGEQLITQIKTLKETNDKIKRE